jgi:hypothetical protein
MLRALSPLFKSALFCFVLCLAPTLFLAGCDKPAQDMPAGASTRRTVVIGIIAKSQSNPVFSAAHAGAIAAAAELGPKYGVDVKVEILTPTEEDAVKQAGRSSTPPEPSAARRTAGWARGSSRRSSSWRWRQSTLSTSSSQGVLASKRPSSRTALAPHWPRHTKLVHSSPCSSQLGSPCHCHCQSSGWSR